MQLFLFVLVFVVSVVTLVLLLFIPLLSDFQCLEAAVLLVCDIFRMPSLIIVFIPQYKVDLQEILADIYTVNPLYTDTRHNDLLIEFVFNDTSTLVGDFPSSPKKRGKRARRESRDEKEGHGRHRNKNESEETEEIKTFPLYHYLLQGWQAPPNCKQISVGRPGNVRHPTTPRKARQNSFKLQFECHEIFAKR